MCLDSFNFCYNNCSWPYLLGLAVVLTILFIYLFTKLLDVVIVVSVIAGVFLLCTGYWYFSGKPKATAIPPGPPALYNNGGGVASGHQTGVLGARHNYKSIEEQSLISESNDII